MYSFLRRPIWILSHVLIALLVLTMIGLGFWQRARWHEERDERDKLEQLATAAAVPFADVVPDVDPAQVDEDVAYRRVVVDGTYDLEHEVAIRNRSNEGAPGAWVLTPLVQPDGVAVAVVRGWMPYDPIEDAPPFEVALPPSGEVVVTGNVQLTQQRGSFGATDAEGEDLDALARVDLERLAEQVPYELEPAWVLLDAQDPPQTADLPTPVQLQSTDPSQNFSYMMQWWIFATIAAIGYPLTLRVVARNKARGDQTPEVPETPEPLAS